jgi:hypothetical protein
MKKLIEGNVYNVQQVSTLKPDSSKTGLDQWTSDMRKHVMEKLRGYAPEKVDQIIKSTFGNVMTSENI